MARVLQFCVALLLCLTVGVYAQKGGKPPKMPAPPHSLAVKPSAPPKASGFPKADLPKASQKGGMNNPNNLAQRLFQMPLEERERVLEKLPPRQQERLRENLEKLDRLPPAQKEFITRQFQSLQSLPPEKQRVVIQGFQAFNQLPEDRRTVIRRELSDLRSMSESDRQARLATDEFKKKFSPSEQQILSGLSQNLPPDYPLAR